MSDKVKPWHKRRPNKKHGNKRIVPLRVDGDKRISPLRVDDSRVIPLHAGDSVEDDWRDDEEQGSFRP